MLERCLRVGLGGVLGLFVAVGAVCADDLVLTKDTLVRLIDQELLRTQCLNTAVGPDWNAATRAAAERFLDLSKLEAATGLPTARLFVLLANAPDEVCRSGAENNEKCFTYKGEEYCE